MNRGIGVPVFFFALITFIIALIIFDEYGIAWDEPWQIETTQVNYNYIFKGDKTLLGHEENIYGMAVELPLLFLQKLLGLKDTRDIYLMRHLMSHLLWLAGIIVFILLVFRISSKVWLSILAGIFIYLMPRIFAHSFFNTKDVPFLVFAIFCQYTFLLSYKKPWPHIIWHGILTGLLINIRLMGLLLVVMSIGFYLYKSLIEKKPRDTWLVPVTYLVISFATLWATWPFLWESPFQHLAEAFRIMMQYPWDDPVLYLGRQIPGNQLPWHYSLAWIAISTPILYLLLFIAGLIAITGKVVHKLKKDVRVDEKRVMDFFQLGFFFIPLLMVILLKSTLYDDWRQLYFIYPSLVYIAISGLEKVWEAWSEQRLLKVLLIALMAIGLCSPAFFMIRHHPYQQVYLNEFIPKSKDWVRHHFDMDYWGLSYRGALEHILEYDDRDTIKVMVAHFPGLHNVEILKPEERARLDVRYTHTEPDYFISNYRYHPEPYPYGTSDWSVIIYNSPIISCWKIE